MRRPPASGLTLIELLLTLGIVAFLLLQALGPWWQQVQQRQQVDALMQELQQMVTMARSSAVAHNSIVTLCRSDDGSSCRGRWHEGSILFTDANANHLLDDSDRLLFRMAPALPRGELRYSAFRNQQYLQLTPQGVTNYQNGSFTWCPADGDLRLARQLIVSFSGRSRMARDRDGDGVVENSKGLPVSCD